MQTALPLELKNDDEAETDKKVDSKKKGWFSSMFQSIAGKENLEKADLEPALKARKDRLMTKNVKLMIYKSNLLGHRLKRLLRNLRVYSNQPGGEKACFFYINSAGELVNSILFCNFGYFMAVMKDALVRILTPRHSIDILRNVHVSKEQRKPYVVVFVGVNRVGKSINLAKHDINVMMAACDTFRSGAVEQLRTHARRLQTKALHFEFV
uniref:SRP54-type proteins GTP-binding domain-containing protein n=1 Tax=Lactuca sativa TaxID=4236 RepID=A0A9R1UI94_LACSA|nr:hypothetical protein LSAT_V11C900481790 [Lactuca sativa]